MWVREREEGEVEVGHRNRCGVRREESGGKGKCGGREEEASYKGGR